MQVTFTRFKSSEPLSKRYWLEDGTIHKQPAANMYSGTAERLTMSFVDFASSFDRMDGNTAYGYGVHSGALPDKVNIVTKGRESGNSISRSKDHFSYPTSGGILMLDHDPSEYGKSYTPDELMALLIKIHPALATAARLVRGSVSSGVHRVGDQPKPSPFPPS